MAKKNDDHQPKGKPQPQKRSGRREYNVSPEDFIRTWQTSDTPQQVADKLGMPKPIVLARASSYRADGINLKKMRRDSKRALDVAALNRLIEQLDAGRKPEDIQEDEEKESPARPVNRVRRTAKDTVKELLKNKDKGQ